MKKHRVSIILTCILIISSVYSITIGVIDIKLIDLFTQRSEEFELILISRLPRLLAILCTGAGLAIAGMIMQQLTSNKFVSPSTGATIPSAQLGILVSLIFFPSIGIVVKSLFAFIFAMLGTGAFIFFTQKIKFKEAIMVPLIGIMFGNIIGGVIDYLSYEHDLIQAMTSWLVGDFSLIVRGRYEIVFIVVPIIIIAFIYANHFNIVGMGENFSKNLGINYKFVLFLGLGICSLIAASTVVIVGSVPYVGLIVPNLISMLKGDKLKDSLYDTAVGGAIFVLICDVIGRLLIAPYEIPIHLVIGVIGSIVFLVMLFKKLQTKKVVPENKQRCMKEEF